MRFILACLAVLTLVGCVNDYGTVPAKAPDGTSMLCKWSYRSNRETKLHIEHCIAGELP